MPGFIWNIADHAETWQSVLPKLVEATRALEEEDSKSDLANITMREMALMMDYAAVRSGKLKPVMEFSADMLGMLDAHLAIDPAIEGLFFNLYHIMNSDGNEYAHLWRGYQNNVNEDRGAYINLGLLEMI